MSSLSSDNLWKLATFLLLGVVIGYGVSQVPLFEKTQDNQPIAAAPRLAGEPLPPEPPVFVDVSVDDDAVKGEADAPITVIEFSDFECPYCGRFFTDTLPQIEKNYIDTGKVKFVYRDFPLTNLHAKAFPAAEAAECAEDQGQFWEMHDKLFENSAQWAGAADSIAVFKTFAEELGLDGPTFTACLDGETHKEEIQKDLKDGALAGISGTPTFFVNGQRVIGAQPYPVFEQLFESILSK